MLRCCLPTVRVPGGPGNTLFNFVRASSAYRCTLKLGNSESEDILSPHGLRVPAVAIYAQPSFLGVEPNIGEEAELPITPPPSPTFGETCQYETGAVAICHHGGRPASGGEGCGIRQSGPDHGHGHDVSSSTSISKLKSFLSSLHATSHPSVTVSPSSIRSLYLSAKARSNVRELTASEMSGLISLFGTLSTSARDRPRRSIFAQPLPSSLLQLSAERSYWPFVAQLAGDKHKLIHKLNHSDHYWVMLAQLAEAEALDSGDSSNVANARLKKAMSGARAHYQHVGRFSAHPDVHLPYLQALLRHPTAARLDEVVESLCGLMGRGNGLPLSLLNVVWQTIVNHDLLPHSREKIAESFIVLAKRRDAIIAEKQFYRDEGQSRPSVKGVRPFSVKELPRALAEVAIRSPKATSNMPHGYPLSQWANSVAGSILTSDQLDRASIFRRLFMLAAVCYPANRTILNDVLSAEEGFSSTPEVDWDVACILAALEQLVDGNAGRHYASSTSTGVDPSSLQSTLFAVWSMWIASFFDVPRDPLVSAMIVGSFYYIAGRVKDYRIVRSCAIYSKTITGHNEDSFFRGMAIHCLSVEHILSSVACGIALEPLFSTVAETHKDRRLLSSIFDDVVQRIAKNDALLASEGISVCQRLRAPVGANAVILVATNLAVAGHLSLALDYVEDERLDSIQQRQLLKSVLKSFSRRIFPRLSTDCAPSLAKFVLRVGPSDPLLRSVRDELRYTLFNLAVRGDVGRVVKLVQDLHKADATYLPRWFLLKLYRCLIQERRHRLARYLLKGCLGKAEPCKSITGRGCETLGTPSRAITNAMHNGGTESLSLLDDSAKGNRALHRHLMRKSKRYVRRMEKMLAAMRKFARTGKFVPDRVSVNILLKGLLLWNEVDKDTVRGLFDRIVLGGFPTGGLYPEGTAPFRTEMILPSSSISLPKVESPASFPKHVRPLYKLFIRAMSMRKDYNGAKVVSKILRALQEEYTVTYAERWRARQFRRRKMKSI